MRDWLTVIIILLILGIALDGLRRLRAHRRNSLRYSRNTPEDGSSALQDDLTSEFPSGGARVATRRDPNEVPKIYQTVKESHAASKITRGAPTSRATDKDLDSGIPAPMSMTSVEDTVAVEDAIRVQAKEPAIGSLDDLDSAGMDGYTGTATVATARQSRFDAWETGGDEDEYQEELLRRYQEQPEPQAEPERELQPPVTAKPESQPLPKPELAPVAKTPDPPEKKEPKEMPDEVLIINIMAKGGQLFPGDELLQAMLDQGLRFGEMDIFHRHQSENGEGPILFSVANMVKPGTFDLAAMEEFATPGISMFLTLPIRGDSLSAYTLMAQTAQNLAQELGGELKDENRSVMTRQTIEHGRQRVIEYERKRRLARA